MAVNDFLPFAATDTGTNLLEQSDYISAANRPIGNQPGVASSKLINKVLRQSAYISSQFAQFLANKTGTDILDDASPAKLLAQINAAILPLAPTLTAYTTGSGNHNLSYWFFILAGSATAGATYTNNGVTYTVKATVASGVQVLMSGSSAPTVSGTLTKASGTGDATITFYSVRAPLVLFFRAVGGGGGGSGSGTSAGGPAGAGGDTTFGIATAGGGAQGVWSGGGAVGGTATPGYASAFGVTGMTSGAFGFNNAAGFYAQGGQGGSSPYYGGGGQGGNPNGGGYGASGYGSGGGGGGTSSISSCYSGPGGASGALVEGNISSPSGAYAYAIGIGGGYGGGGPSGFQGGSGLPGRLYIEERYQ